MQFSHITKFLAGVYVHSGHDNNLNKSDNTFPDFILQQIWCIHLSQKSHEICKIDKCINVYTLKQLIYIASYNYSTAYTQ